jgi:probable HAF family extracellular repeat protein
MHSRLTSAAAALALAAASLPLHAQVTLTGLGTSISNLRVDDVSADGSAIVARNSTQAYLWTVSNPTWTAIPGSAGVFGSFDVSNGGAFVCATLPDPNNSNLETAARWSASTGQWTFLPGLGAWSGSSYTSSYDMSADGSVVVGLGWISANRAHAFRWDASSGQTIDLGAFGGNVSSSRPNAVSADGNVAVGWDEDDTTGTWRAARWVGVNESLLGCLDPNDPINGPSQSHAVSSNGQFIAGESSTGLYTASGWSEQHAFRWSAVGGLIDVGTTPVDPFGWGTHATVPTAISDDGRTIVGFAGIATFGPGATRPQFIWREGSGMSEIAPFLIAMGVNSAANWVFEYTAGMSSDGRVIVGHGLNASFQREVWRIELPPIAENFCTAKVNSLGCTPAMTSSGIASASSTLPFDVGAVNVLNNKNGLLYYGLAPLNAPFQGGTKCVAQPARRTGVQDSFGNAGPNDCSGAYSIDLNVLIQGGGDPALAIGETIYTQYWTRDPASPSTTGLTDGMAITIFP